MDELHRNRPFANSGCYSFHRTMPHIAYGKKTGNVGLKQKRVPVERPPFGALPVSYKIGTRQQETTFVALDQTSKPIRSRKSANEDEHGARRHSFYFVGIRTKHRNLFQM